MIGPMQKPLPDNTQHSQETDIRDPAEFEPAIPASERPQIHALDRVATGTGMEYLWGIKKKTLVFLFPSVGLLLQLFSPFKGTDFVNCIGELWITLYIFLCTRVWQVST